LFGENTKQTINTV